MVLLLLMIFAGWIVILDSDSIKVLTGDDIDKGNEVLLPKLYQSLLHILQLYYAYQKNERRPAIGDDWSSFTADEFNDFHLNVDQVHLTMTLQTFSVTSLASQVYYQDPVADFRKDSMCNANLPLCHLQR